MSNLTELWDDMYGGVEKTAGRCCNHRGCPPNKCLKKGKRPEGDEPDPDGEESPEGEAAEEEAAPEEKEGKPAGKPSGLTFRDLMARAGAAK